MNRAQRKSPYLLSLLAVLVVHCAVDDRQLEGLGTGIIGSGNGSSGGAPGFGGDRATAASGGGDAGDAPGTPGSGGDASGGIGSEDGGDGNTSATTGAGNAGNAGGTVSGDGGTGATGAGGGGVVDPQCPDFDANGVGDCEETLVDNAAFDSEPEGWSPESDVSALWDIADGASYEESGSLSISNQVFAEETGGFTLAGAGQCIEATADETYLFLTQVFIDGGQGQGRGGLNVWFFDGADCTGNLDATNTQLASVPGEWAVTYLRAQAPADAVSMRVRLVIQKPFSQPSFEVNFDNVLVRVD